MIGSSPGITESIRTLAATASRSDRNRASARPPQTNSTRCPPLNFSDEAVAMTPMAPVRATCVPPHAERSKSSTSISRNVPSRAGGFRSFSADASSAVAYRTRTGRSSHTMRLASSRVKFIDLLPLLGLPIFARLRPAVHRLAAGNFRVRNNRRIAAFCYRVFEHCCEGRGR